MSHVKFKNETYVVNGAQIIPASAPGQLCNAIGFYNPLLVNGAANTAIAYVNGQEIPVGAWWSPGLGYAQEIDVSEYKVRFSSLPAALIVTRKIYQQ